MNDLIGDFETFKVPKRPTIQQNDSVDFLSSDTASIDPGLYASTRSSSIIGREQSMQVLNFLDATPISQEAPTLPHTLGEVNGGQGDDDFGDFVESPQPDRGYFPTSIDSSLGLQTHKPEQVPLPADLLRYIMENVLIVPQAFIAELANVPYISKKAILNAPKTKRWLDALVEGQKIAQRIMYGRTRATKDVQARREAQLAAERLAEQWSSTLLPRITSLSGGSLRLKALRVNTFDDIDTGTQVCYICRTEAEDRALLENSKDGLLGHRSCIALLMHFEGRM